MIAHFLLIRTNEETSTVKHFFESEKRQYLPHFGSDEGFKGINVNRAMSSLQGGSLEIKIIVLLNIWFVFKCKGERPR